MRRLNGRLTPTQAHMVAIVECINGAAAARKLAATYRTHNRLWKAAGGME